MHVQPPRILRKQAGWFQRRCGGRDLGSLCQSCSRVNPSETRREGRDAAGNFFVAVSFCFTYASFSAPRVPNTLVYRWLSSSRKRVLDVEIGDPLYCFLWKRFPSFSSRLPSTAVGQADNRVGHTSLDISDPQLWKSMDSSREAARSTCCNIDDDTSPTVGHVPRR